MDLSHQPLSALTSYPSESPPGNKLPDAHTMDFGCQLVLPWSQLSLQTFLLRSSVTIGTPTEVFEPQTEAPCPVSYMVPVIL